VVWRKVLWLVVVSGCVERKSDAGRGQGKVSLDVWLLALLGLCLRAYSSILLWNVSRSSFTPYKGKVTPLGIRREFYQS
jgi:hypothetical protein